MKIAIDCHTLEVENWAGKEQALFNILKALTLADKENEYILYFRKPIIKKISLPDKRQVKSFNFPTPFWHLVVLFDLLFISRVKILFVPCAYLLPALKFFIPSVVLLHDLTAFIPEIKETHEKNLILKEKLFVELALKKAHTIISVSQSTKNDCLKYFKIFPEKIKVVYPGNKNHLRPIKDHEEIDKVLKEYKLPEKFLLSVSTLEPRKNIENLIKAYQVYLNANPHFHFPLLLVGKKGWYYKNFFQLVSQLKLEDKVIFTGYLPEEVLPFLYSRAEVVLYPSLYEGFGSPVLEAMSCGAPVITSNNSSLPEVAGDAAILVNPYEISEIKLAIEKVLSNETLRNDMIRKGLIQAQKFSWSKFVGELLIIFNSISSNKKI